MRKKEQERNRKETTTGVESELPPLDQSRAPPECICIGSRLMFG